MYNAFKIKDNVIDFVNNSENELKNSFNEIDDIYEKNQLKVLKSFIDMKISESHFQESTGYGYTDIGRDKIEELYSKVFNTQDALVRQQIVSGTHAISLCLFACTMPGDKILSINGLPYDTLHSTIGLHGEQQSLKDYNVSFSYVDLKNDDFDYEAISKKLKEKIKLIMIQRSRGYTEKKALSVSKIGKVIEYIKSLDKDVLIMVDNCYGEFVNDIEPTDVGADIMCGSLIKNPGGSLAKSGGYIVGRNDLIERCANRLTAPGIGKEVGINFNQNRNILQGLYFAPQIVSNAMKIVKLYSFVCDKLKIDTIPSFRDEINDIVISIKLGSEDRVKEFCKVIQETSPIDSHLSPIESDMPGYDSKVIMAAGNFISGSSIELSCDAPLRSPYIVYLQGGINYFQGKLALMKYIEKLNLI